MRAIKVVAVLCLLTSGAQGQEGAGRIAGTIRATSDSSALSGARVTIRDTDISARTNDSGVFVLDRTPVGTVMLEVRRLGFRALDTTISIGADASLAVWLTPVPRRLAEIDVKGKRILIPAHMRAVYERADRNHGTLITADDIERVFPQDTKAMLQGIAGIRVELKRVHFVRCSNIRGAGAPFPASSPRVHVYVNGHRHTTVGDEYEVKEVIDAVHPNDIELIEVYGGVARIPVDFLVDACAVVAIWTKAY